MMPTWLTDPQTDRCHRCGDPDARPVPFDGDDVALCETCHGFVRSARRVPP